MFRCTRQFITAAARCDRTRIAIWPIVICSIMLLAADGGQPTELKDFGNRLEGTTVRPNALEDFTFISVDRSIDQFPKNSTLSVRFFIPQLPKNQAKTIFLEARELQDSFHYFMKAKPFQCKEQDWNIFQPWPTSAVIDSLNLDASNLGVRAGYQIGNHAPVFTPVDVYRKIPSASKPAYTFHFITGQDLQSIDISVIDDTGRIVKLRKPHLKCNKQRSPNCVLYPAGSTQAFDLDMSSLAGGEYRINLVGHIPRTSATTSLEVLLYHYPGPE